MESERASRSARAAPAGAKPARVATPPAFGELLRQHRVAAGLTQEELAERAGLSVRAVSYLEQRANSRPWKETVRLLGEALELSEADAAVFERAARRPRGDDAAPAAVHALPAPPAEVAADPPAAPPLLSGVAAVRRGNLPRPLTRLIGRTWELAEVMRLVEAERLVTLLGPGGTGKTRLALEVAVHLADHFPDGVWFVDLAPVRDPQLVLPAVVRALDVPERGSEPIAAVLSDHLVEREALLVLDNLEQVVEAAPALVQVLQAAPRVRALVTSREPLQVRGEHTFDLPPLEVPDPVHRPPPNVLAAYPAVALFVERVRAGNRRFALTPETADAVATIVARLDGLPLAIELAAARVPPLGLAELARQLASRLDVLTLGLRDLPDRHRTMRAAIAWSHDLLTPEEQALFRRLAVFLGGFTLDAAEAVVGVREAAPGIASLAGKSLLYELPAAPREAEAAGGARFAMLETIREYALERLAADPEAQRVQAAHAAHFLALATAAEARLQGPAQTAWLERLEAAHDNLRAALDWSLSGGDPALGVRLAGTLARFWDVRGHFQEGRRWLDRAVDVLAPDGAQGGTAPGPGAGRAAALVAAGVLADRQGDFAAARARLEAAVSLARAAGDRPALASALVELSRVNLEQGDYAATRALLEECLALCRELSEPTRTARVLADLGRALYEQGEHAAARSVLEEAAALYRTGGDRRGLAGAVNLLGSIATVRGEWAIARALFAEALALRRELGAPQGVAASLNNLAALAVQAGDWEGARELYERSLALRRELGERAGTARVQHNLGWLARLRGELDLAEPLLSEALAARREIGDVRGAASSLRQLGQVVGLQDQPARAAELLGEALTLAREIGDQPNVVDTLGGVAAVAAATSRPELAERAVRLFAADAALRQTHGPALYAPEQIDVDHTLAALRATLGDAAFEAAWEQGRSLALANAVDAARQLLESLAD